MNETELLLLKETEKWLSRLKKKSLPPSQQQEVREQITNIKAYLADCQHFLEKKDYVRAFEAVVYAWGIFETLEKLGLLKR